MFEGTEQYDVLFATMQRGGEEAFFYDPVISSGAVPNDAAAASAASSVVPKDPVTDARPNNGVEWLTVSFGTPGSKAVQINLSDCFACECAKPTPAVGSKQTNKGSKKKKRKSAKKAVKAAKKEAKATSKKAKATPERDPQGVRRTEYGKYRSETRFAGKQRSIGTFDTSEQAAAAYLSVRKDLDDAKLSAVGAAVAYHVFDEAKKKALETFGGFVPEKRDGPRGIQKLKSGKYQAKISCSGKYRCIGTFDTSEQASAAFLSVRKDLDNAKLSGSAAGADKADAIFDAAKKAALETFGRLVPEKPDVSKDIEEINRVKAATSKKKKSKATFVPPGSPCRQMDSPNLSPHTGCHMANDRHPTNIATYGTPPKAKEGNSPVAKGSGSTTTTSTTTTSTTSTSSTTTSCDTTLPQGVAKTFSIDGKEKYIARIGWCGTYRKIGVFDTPEEASVAYMTVSLANIGRLPILTQAELVFAYL